MRDVTPKRIAAVVLTLNEEHNIEYCLRSVRPWCDELVLVDMFSDDRTVELARPYVDTVLAHERIHAFDLGRQRGIDAATGDWIFSIDADEVVPPQLGRWMRAFVDADPEYDLAQIPRINVFLGRRMHSTPWWPGKPRLFRRGAVLVTADLHHGLVPRAGARVAQVPKKPQLSLWHFTRLSIDALTAKMNHYTTIEARQANARGRGDPPDARGSAPRSGRSPCTCISAATGMALPGLPMWRTAPITSSCAKRNDGTRLGPAFDRPNTI